MLENVYVRQAEAGGASGGGGHAAPSVGASQGLLRATGDATLFDYSRRSFKRLTWLWLCVQVELGQWEKALALAPAVSLAYWRDLAGRRASSLQVSTRQLLSREA
jgi:hypothetical protein